MNSQDRGRKSEDGSQRTAFRQNFHAKNRSGMTLVEVLLAAAILGIMSVVVIHALFYPRLLAVSSTLKQLAVQAGAGEIERLRANYFYDTMPGSSVTNLTTKFNLKGRSIIASNRVETVSVAAPPGYAAGYQYKRITVTVSYPYGNSTTNVTLITYRSEAEVL